MILPLMPIRYTSKYAIYQFCFHEHGMLKSVAVKVKLSDVVKYITEKDRVGAIMLLNFKYNSPLYDKIENKEAKIEASVFGMDMIETIVDEISPLIGA